MQNHVERNGLRARRAFLAASLGAAMLLGLGTPAAAQVAGQSLTLARDTGIVRLERARSEADAVRRLELERGKSILMETGYQTKQVSVGDPEVLQVLVLSPRRLQVVPKNIGDTNLVIWDTRGRAQAVIDVHVGTANSQIETELRRVLGNETIQVDSAGDSVVLKGSVPSALAVEQAMSVAKAFFPKDPERHVINLLQVGGNQQVRIDIKLVEMSRTLNRDFTVNFNVENVGTFRIFDFLDSASSASFTPTSITTNFLVPPINLVYDYIGSDDILTTFFLRALQAKGLAKVLAEPTVVAASGESASFLVGGEIPIPVSQGGANAGSITIQFKPFGIGVAFKPTVLRDDRIHLEISPEVSDADFSRTVNGVPTFTTRRASTRVELADGQTFAIAGLLEDSVQETVSQYPFLGDIPVLGTLFRSSEFRSKKTELVLIATPHLVKPLGPGPHPLPTDHFIERSALSWYFLGALEGTKGSSRGTHASASSMQYANAGEGETSGLIGEFGHRVVITEAEKEIR